MYLLDNLKNRIGCKKAFSKQCPSIKDVFKLNKLIAFDKLEKKISTIPNPTLHSTKIDASDSTRFGKLMFY